MNERIKELVEQAGITLSDRDGWWVAYDEDLERLVELVEAAAVARGREVNKELVGAVEQALEGSWLDPQGLNHDDDSLFYIARAVSDQWGKPQLMAHIKRLSIALAKARGEK
jgi:hypothetical protein